MFMGQANDVLELCECSEAADLLISDVTPDHVEKRALKGSEMGV